MPLYIVSYTLIFNVYWGIMSKDKRLNFIWKPYVEYLCITAILSLALLDSLSLPGIVLAPLFGLLCLIMVRRYKHFRKIYATTFARRMTINVASIALIIAIVTIPKVWSVSAECQGHGSFRA